MSELKLTLTQDDFSIVLLLWFSEIALAAAFGEIDTQNKLTTKWEKTQQELENHYVNLHEQVNQIQDALDLSVRGRDLIRDQYMLSILMKILLNIDNDEIQRLLISNSEMISKVNEEAKHVFDNIQ